MNLYKAFHTEIDSKKEKVNAHIVDGRLTTVPELSTIGGIC